ncbi:P-loop NTPase fold protein [Kribbella sp. NPDC026611]|uniref:P-loop NTPase fold protein n=1 Tax=Kribbella sp. NPDC026611 TaxID=3154911 RepID=UPI0033F2CF87
MAGQIGYGEGLERVDVVHGDVFDQGADIVVVPCSVHGSVSSDFADRLARLGVDSPTGSFSLGEVVEARSTSSAHARILFAAVVTDEGTRVRVIEQAAREIGFRTAEDSVVAFPLLGTGAGGMEPGPALLAILNGFMAGAPAGARAKVCVLGVAVFRRLIEELDADPAQHSSAETDATRPPAVPPRPDENVPTHTDGPARVDELGREGLAMILARRIRAARREQTRRSSSGTDRGGTFLLHVHAPWGAGKTSLLNFLATELRTPGADGRRNVVIDFNAWQHQRIGPPWWWLMTTIYTGAVSELKAFDRRRAISLWLHEWWWRLRSGLPGFLILAGIIVVLVLAVRGGWFQGIRRPDDVGAAVKSVLFTVAAIVTSLVTIWGLVHGFGRWLFATSARGARRFVSNTNDPMGLVRKHLRDLAAWIDYDIVVMVDDLDRCKAPYVVELLEGIQTLFRDVPITYVVAADRDWLADSYAGEYAGFASAAEEAGRPIGYLFLEKTFQISTGLPASTQVAAFWSRILRRPAVPDQDELERARRRAQEELGREPGDIARRRVAADPGNSPADIQARLEAVAVGMVSEQAQLSNAHALEPFQPLLGADPNPRMMKRLVNAYGIARGIETLQGVNLEDDATHGRQTALWTILSMRWPKLAAALAKRPDAVAAIGDGPVPPGIPAELAPLFTDAEVIDVVRGKGVDAALDADAIRATVLR